eukprot:scaffold1149_cov236-Pinguiococcus_pyrenoidosus.AAC.11
MTVPNEAAFPALFPRRAQHVGLPMRLLGKWALCAALHGHLSQMEHETQAALRTAHVYGQFQRRVVRDLYWSLASPHLLTPLESSSASEVPSKASGGSDAAESEGRDSDAGELDEIRRLRLRFFDDAEAQTWTSHPETLEWLRQLDDDPSRLLEWVDARRYNLKRLGYYFAALLEFWVHFAPALGDRQVTDGCPRCAGSCSMVGYDRQS